jgi:hypothetical protein
MCHVSRKMCVWYSQERYVCAMCQKRCVYGIARKGMYVPCVKKDVCMVKPGKVCICHVSRKMCVWYSQERYVCAMRERYVCGIARKDMCVPCVKDMCFVQFGKVCVLHT